MPNHLLNVDRPMSKLHYAKVNNMDPRRLLLHAPRLFSDFYYYRHEFDRTLLAAEWVTAAASGTPFAYAAARAGGMYTGVTNALDNATAEIHQTNVAIDSADFPMLFLRWRAPADATGMAFEIGWSDAKTSEALVCVSALTNVDNAVPTIANGITDFGLLVGNPDLALATSALIGDGTTGSVVGKKNPTLWMPSNNGIIDMVIGVGPNVTNAKVWDNGQRVASLTVGNGPDSAVLTRFSALWKTVDAGAKSIDLLKFIILAEENAT